MASNGLSPRRQLIASLIAQGWSNVRVAKHLGVSLTCVKDARRLPAVQAAIARESAQLREAVRFELAKAMADEERATFERWRALRDQDENLPVALGAVKAHFDRTLPKATAALESQPPVIVFTREERRAIEVGFRKAGITLPEIPGDSVE